ncbi:tubby-related protein 4-like [Babylonia areolata]|uniref:tubby-related protein 4-like n=1 Tax=Babylonia areolata TaxID=304850 RepID=UPI003FD34559
MHVHFEQNNYTRTDCNFHSLSWMGKVPDSLPDEGGGWKLNRAQYYMEGWLASGNGKGIVGITFTTSHCQKYEAPPRSNFNLRGHRCEVILVKWNEPYQRLATCDSRGVIFVWIKHEGRWSIELINDRNSQVTDFAWSHDGRMALICYRDGFVLVGSVAGQRYWSSMLNLDTTAITCGIWSPDDQEVMFGTTDGQVIVMSSTGAMLRQFTVHENNEILSMAWSCEKFNMEEADHKDPSADSSHREEGNPSILAICFKFGDIFLVNGYDDVCPSTVHTSLQGLKMEWSNCGQYLAVGGFTRLPNLQCHNELHFYSREGKRFHWVTVPSQGKPLTAITWGHNDKRLFVAAGCQLYVAWVSKQVAPLHFLCSRVVHKCVRHERNADFLPLPQRIRQGVQSLFSPTVKSYVPDPFKLRGFVSTPPPGNERLFCTMIRHGDETSGGHYTLYLEYLGGLVPLLKGKRASKLRPDFVIFDPKIRTSGKGQGDPSSLQTDSSSESDGDVAADGCGSPRMQRRRRQKVFRAERVERSITFRTLDELLYNDNLPESNKLVEVTSNIWGTKFHITGVASYLPSVLGSVVYKTSLLHLQPRQMTIHLQEVCGSSQPLARDPNFTPAGVSDEDEEASWPKMGEAAEVTQQQQNNSQATSVQVDSWGDKLGGSPPPPQVCCVDVQAPSSATVTPVHTTNMNISSSSSRGGGGGNGNNSGGSVVGVGGGVSSLCPLTNSTAGIRSRSLSPVQDSSTQTTTTVVAFNNGELSALSSSKDIYATQGARPKVKKNSAAKRPSTVKALPGSAHTVITYANTSTSSTQTATCTSSHSPLSALPADLTDSELTCSPVSPEPEVADILKRISSGGGEGGSRWADPASHSIKYMDDEVTDSSEAPFESNLVADSGSSSAASCSSSAAASSVILKRRLYLAQGGVSDGGAEEGMLVGVGVGMSLDRGGGGAGVSRRSAGEDSRTDSGGKLDLVSAISTTMAVMAGGRGGRGGGGGGGVGSDIEILHSASLPSSPIHGPSKSETPTRRRREEVLKNQCRHLSPVLARKGRLEEGLESLDDDLVLTVMEDFKGGKSYRNLETFQKAQLKHKLRRVQGSCGGQFVMHNKAPLWNENSQVYQLDFGGRVTQESAKNFQIELQGKQVMQFGRIDSNAYTLDFQYPFTALQAFAVALANVTQRLK